MVFPPILAVLVTVSALVAGCGHHAAGPPGASSKPSKPVAAPVPPPCGDVTTLPIRDPVAAPVPPACGDVTTLPIRDKLAQLLMVGVKNADDARDVVSDYHVGGIFFGGWTDLSILDGPLTDIKTSAGP